jgi:hypothetical protein
MLFEGVGKCRGFTHVKTERSEEFRFRLAGRMALNI